jgi:hypothetical protein
VDDRRLVGGEGEEVAVFRADALDQLGRDRLDELGDAGVETGADDLRDGQSLRAEPLRPLRERVGFLTRHLRTAGDDDRLHHRRVLEHAEFGRVGEIGDVVQLHAKAQVGPIRSVLVDGLVVLHVRDRVGDVDAEDLLPDAAEELLHDGDDVLAIDEAHLDVELRELSLPIRAGVFVAEAADDLHVLVHAADHQDLLEQLRRLRQGVKASRHQARGTRKSRLPFGRALGEERASRFSQNPWSPSSSRMIWRRGDASERLVHLRGGQVNGSRYWSPALVDVLGLVAA